MLTKGFSRWAMCILTIFVSQSFLAQGSYAEEGCKADCLFGLCSGASNCSCWLGFPFCSGTAPRITASAHQVSELNQYISYLVSLKDKDINGLVSEVRVILRLESAKEIGYLQYHSAVDSYAGICKKLPRTKLDLITAYITKRESSRTIESKESDKVVEPASALAGKEAGCTAICPFGACTASSGVCTCFFGFPECGNSVANVGSGSGPYLTASAVQLANTGKFISYMNSLKDRQMTELIGTTKNLLAIERVDKIDPAKYGLALKQYSELCKKLPSVEQDRITRYISTLGVIRGGREYEEGRSK
jgi:hypothetical protein